MVPRSLRGQRRQDKALATHNGSCALYLSEENATGLGSNSLSQGRNEHSSSFQQAPPVPDLRIVQVPALSDEPFEVRLKALRGVDLPHNLRQELISLPIQIQQEMHHFNAPHVVLHVLFGHLTKHSER